MHGPEALQRALDRMLEEASTRIAVGKRVEASRSYLKAAQFAEQLIDLTEDEDASAAEAWRLRTIEYRARAQALAKDRFDERRCKPHTAHEDDDKVFSDEDSDNLEQQILLLIDETPKAVTWDSIGGMDALKRELKFHYGLALAKAPPGVRLEGWRNIMLYGPPGTGKTLMACAIAHKLSATFFNVKANQLVSKWVGESGKLVSTLYRMARKFARNGTPSIIFIDEFDAICKSREDAGHLYHQQMLASILSELDGYANKQDDALVLTIGATNRPSDLDPAVLSRFERQVHVGLPDAAARADIFRIHLEDQGIAVAADLDYGLLAAMSDGYSGRDIKHLCKQVVAAVIEEMNPELPELVDRGLETVRDYTVRLRGLETRDFEPWLVPARPA